MHKVTSATCVLRVVFTGLLLTFLMACLQPSAHAQLADDNALWFAMPPRLPAVDLYFFWSKSCPHCQEARPFIESLSKKHPWIRPHSYELLEHPENQEYLAQLAEIVGFSPSSVPTFIWCGDYYTGYDSDAQTGQHLLAALQGCYEQVYLAPPTGTKTNEEAVQAQEVKAAEMIELPWLGGLDPGQHSLAFMAVVMGALDAFNPCAFFVLLFLLSLLVNTQNRARMLMIGGLFVLVSGLVYFAFMAAWLNLFQVLGHINTVTLLAGVLAILIGSLNTKDYFRLREGPSLSITDGHRQALLNRMRGLLNNNQLPAVLVGTVVLALAANSYELLCTMGLPMVFTRILTLEQLPNWQYYAYLALYNLVYILPLAVIVGIFVATMGRRKLSESEGRFLKLMSGIMMLGLGLVLVLSPDRLSDPLTAVILIGTAILVTLVIHWLHKRPGHTR